MRAALRALEFDRIVAVLTELAVTPTGASRLAALHPSVDRAEVTALHQATTEGTQFLRGTSGIPLRAPEDLETILDALSIEGRALEAARLLALADYVESIDLSRAAVTNIAVPLPRLRALVGGVASFKAEIADVRKKIDAAGEVADNASPALASMRGSPAQAARAPADDARVVPARDVTRRSICRIRSSRIATAGTFLVVRAEHRSSIPGIIHGASASGASLYLEPMDTVELNKRHRRARGSRKPQEVQAHPPRADRRLSQPRRGFAAHGRRRHRARCHPGARRVFRRPSTVSSRSSRPTVRSNCPARAIRLLKERYPSTSFLTPPTRVLVITGPNTGGKTVALKTAGLFVAMAQAGLHLRGRRGLEAADLSVRSLRTSATSSRSPRA
jgi:DNA mismatch repair protein MutS2